MLLVIVSLKSMVTDDWFASTNCWSSDKIRCSSGVHQCLLLDALQNLYSTEANSFGAFSVCPFSFSVCSMQGVFNRPGVSCLGTLQQQQQQPAKCASSWTPVHLHLGHPWPLTSTPNPLVGRVKASNVAPYIVSTVATGNSGWSLFWPSFSSMPVKGILTLGLYFHLCFDR